LHIGDSVKQNIVHLNSFLGASRHRRSLAVTINRLCGRLTIARRSSRRFLGEHEQVRAAPALQLNFLQHVFTILKQLGEEIRK
jgi:hypothetical protein